MLRRSLCWSLMIGLLLMTGCTIYRDEQVWEVQAAPLPVTIIAGSTLTTTSTLSAGSTPILTPLLPESSTALAKTCPVTLPPEPPFIPPDPYPATPPGDYFWYGSPDLWAAVPNDGIWSQLPHNPTGYTQKLPWWREGYSWTEEPEPELTVTGRRLDGDAPSFRFDDATNAYAPEFGSAMMIGIDLPTLGCWEITGEYEDQTLSFVVWVEP